MIGRLIDDRYLVRSRIARGGMATVYLATDTRLERRVAIKIMHDHLAVDEAFRERFVREARSAAKLAHPNVVNVFDQGDDAGVAYMVMEYVSGITLRDLLHQHKRLTPAQTIDILEAVLSGLQAAHKSGIVHRDLKPENVLLADDGRIKLSDFGLARAASANTATGQVLLGTIAYLSPELVTQGQADIRSDIYAMGIMMFEMLTGEQPYHGDQPVNIAFRHVNESVPAPSSLVSSVPAQLDNIVVWATERDPEARPADAGAMLVAIRQAAREIEAAGGVPVAPVDPKMSVPPSGPSRAQRVVSAGRDDEPTERFANDTGERETYLEQLERAPVPAAPQEPEVAGEPAGSQALIALEEAESESPSSRRSKRLWPLVASLLVIALLAVSLGGWWFAAGPGNERTVPAVAGLSLEEATQNIELADLTIGEVREQPSREIPVDHVINTDPPLGTPLPSGTPVVLIVSSGPAQVEVPPLAGLSKEEAVAAIRGANLIYAEPDDLEFSTQPENTVIRGVTTEGTELPEVMTEGDSVKLVVSVGELPTIVGRTKDQAAANLESVGLKMNVSTEEFSDTVPAGQVISYALDHEPVRPGDTVHVAISRGPEMIEVPNVVGKTTREAVAALEDAGLDPAHNVPDALLDRTRVTGQSPAAGSKQRRGTTVALSASLQF